MRLSVVLPLVLLAAVASGPARAQPGDGARLRYIGPDSGLPSPSVYGIAQDSLGFMWIGTSDGLAPLAERARQRSAQRTSPGAETPGAAVPSRTNR